MRSPIRFVALTAGLAVAVALLPVDVFAQRGGGGRGGGGGGRGGGGGAVARSGPSHGGGGRVSGPPSRGGSGGSGSASARSPYYRGRPNGQGYRANGSYGASGYRYGRPGYGYGHSYYRNGRYGYYRPYYGYGYRYGYRPYYGYYGYGWPYYGFGLSVGYPYWGAYGWGYPYAWGGYWGGYYGRSYDAGDYQGAARLEVKPRETEVFVDGYFAGVVDDFDGFSQRLRLEPGEHEVTLFLEGHRSLTRKMLFTVGQTFKLQHEMEPLGAGEPPPLRPVAPAKPPAPARTRYGAPGMPRQVSGQPGDPADVDPGAPGDRGADISVIEPPDSRPRTERPVQPDEARGPSGTLSIRVQPDDAEVVIDGEPWTRSGGERLVVALAPGVHRLEVRKSGHETYVGLVRIRPGVATTLNVALAAAEAR